MTTYNSGVFRTGSATDAGTAGDPLVPQDMVMEVIKELPTASVALSMMNKTVLSTKTQRMPVMNLMPVAYWVGGDTGLKQTTTQGWKDAVLVVEELAAIVPIPQAYLDDSAIPLWDEIRPYLVAAAGNLIDNATIWNVGKPSSWPASLLTAAETAGNTVVDGTGVDFGQDVAALGQLMAQTQGYSVNGFIAQPGMAWRLTGLRSAQGIPIYQPNMIDGSAVAGKLYGYNMAEVDNSTWNGARASLIGGDWKKAIIGIRQDITFKMADQAVISNDSGVVINNLFQQDSVAFRMVMRVAYTTVNPVTQLNKGAADDHRCAFGAVIVGSGGKLMAGADPAQEYDDVRDAQMAEMRAQMDEQARQFAQMQKLVESLTAQGGVSVGGQAASGDGGDASGAGARRTRKPAAAAK